MSLRDKLKNYQQMEEKNRGTSKIQNHSKPVEIKEDLDKLFYSQLDGEVIRTEAGNFFRRRVTYPLSYSHGIYRLNKVLKQNNLSFSPHRQQLDPGKLLFIDTETTGLMGGTGTVAFLIGAGYIKAGRLIIDQLLMRDFNEELPLLLELNQLIKDHPLLVSFNGKSFDLPLIKTRFILNRLSEPEIDQHFDLLHPARSVWSHLPSCSLNSLEENILGVKREDDLPGSQVPALYFKFLENKQPLLLKPILKHNLLDIVSLVTLLIHLSRIFNGEKTALSGEELFNLARYFERKKFLHKSIEYYQQAGRKAAGAYLQKEVFIKLSWQYKRDQRWEEAVRIWEMMLNKKMGGIFPYIELAKFYEHREKRFKDAYQLTEKALLYLNHNRLLVSDWQVQKEKVIKRKKRLEQKLLQS